ncbi:MAG: RNA methyltransferase, partial [Candidatus Zixiibacteriota bacterium]
AEGVRLLEESIRHKWLPEKVFYAEAALGDRARALVRKLADMGVSTQAISSREAEQISDTRTSQGLTGLFNIPDREVREIFMGRYRRFLLLDGVSDPGNAGVLVRSACAFGFDSILMLHDCVVQFNPKVVRASAGAIFRLPIYAVSLADAANLKKNRKLVFMSGDLAGKSTYRIPGQVKIKNGFILAIGSEANGVSPEIRRLSDIKLRIRHDNAVESLNAAVAGSLIMRDLYESLRIRRVKG